MTDRRWSEVSRGVADTAVRIATARNEHIEGYIGQYLARTGLSITEIMLVEQRMPGAAVRWFCAPKDDRARPVPDDPGAGAG